MKADLRSAETHYLAAARLDRKRTTVYNNLGLVYVRQGKISQAIVQFKEALCLQPDDRSAAENLRLAQSVDARFQTSPSTPR